MNETGLRRIPPDQSSGSGHTFGTLRHPSIGDPILSKRVCFYKSGDPQFNGLRLVINNRTFKTFDALLDSLSKKVPLAFGVRNITTPHGVHAISSLDELEDGKSYICSDRRKVKPINLALARKKLPPWYHARPVSSRRRTVQQARFFPGRNIYRTQPALLRTPKRLLVFRNGEPTVKQTVVLQKKTTPSYESILDFISELMQFHVLKLHTLDGKRVDGLPGLILCSGTVVAVGREPFKPAIYTPEKTSSTTRRYARRQKSSNRKKKLPSYGSNLRNFSASSERYIVDQIHNTITGSSNGFPSNHTNSLELQSNLIMESVAETVEDNILDDGADGQTCSLPNEDDIEKSFRVNQDGSMTVEMRVRLTIKEEETVHWTTTLQRSSVANQLNSIPLPEPEPMEGICSPNSTSADLQNSLESSNETIHRYKTRDNNDDDPPSQSNKAFNESCSDEDESKSQTDMVFPRRAPTPGHKQISKTQTSIESIKSVTTHGIQEDVVGSYSFREQTKNGSTTEQYCMVKQSSSRPVPKPRRLGSVEQCSRNVSRFTSEGMSEVLQNESSGEEVTETVLHIYEQQTCQDNFLPNVCEPYMSAYKNTFDRPATSETGRLSSSNEFEPEVCRPSTASEIISIWRTESMSVASDLKSPSQESVVSKSSKGLKQHQKAKKSQTTVYQGEAHKVKRASPKRKILNKHIRRIMTPTKRKNKNPTGAPDTQKKTRTFSSAGFLRRIYGNKSKSVKSWKNLKKRPMQNGDGGVSKEGLSDDTMKSVENMASVQTGRIGLSSEPNQQRGVLRRQTSMHMEKKNENTFHHSNEGDTQSTFERTNNYAKEYVENWLEKAHLNLQAENIGFGETENKHGLTSEADEVNCPVETLKTETQQARQSQSRNVLGTSVRLQVQSFENKSFNSPVEKMAGSHDQALNEADSINADDRRSLIQTHAGDTKLPPMNSFLPEILSKDIKQDKSNPVKISFQKDTPSRTQSMDLPPPPSSAEMAELSNLEYFMKDGSSAASSPLYKMSSSRTDTHSASVTSSSDKVLSPNDNATEITSSLKTDILSDQKECPLPRVPSIKRAPLVSNKSLERKMSLRKASLDKHTSSIPVNTASDDVPLTRTEQSQKTTSDLISTQSCCASVSPTSLTSEERQSSGSISSNEDLVMSDLLLKDVKNLNGESLSKTLVKKVKQMSTPSPERKLLDKKSPKLLNNSPKLSPVQSRPSKNIPPDVGVHQRVTLNVSPPAGRKQKLYKPKQQKRRSPYSQSLDVASPPARHKTSPKLPLRSLSLESPSETAHKKKKKKVLEARAKRESVKSANELDKTVMSDAPVTLEAAQRENQAAPAEADKERATEVIHGARSLTTSSQLDMKPVLEKICYSIKSIRQITQCKRPSCLEKSNSLPDFSSHVASTFGSSSKALLAFLSVMTLKEGITGLNMGDLHTNNVSCAEALKMIDSLAEIASIEDSHTLKTSLADLQQSTSKQLLQSWKGFQDLSDRCKSRNSTASNSEDEHKASPSPNQDSNLEDSVIDELMDVLDIPEKLKVELASFSEGAKSENADQLSERVVKEKLEDYMSQLSTEDVNDAKCADKLNVDVKSMIKKFTHSTKPESLMESLNLAEKCKVVNQSTKDTDPQKSPREEQVPGRKQCHSQSFEGENLQSCRDVVKQENHSKPEELSSQKDICKQSASVQDTHERKGSEEVQTPGEDFLILESQPENDDTKQPSPCRYVEVNPAVKKTMWSSDSKKQVTAGTKRNSSERETQKLSMGLNVGVEDSTETSEDVEEQPEVESKQLKVIVEETSSGIEEEDEEEEEHVYVLPQNREHTAKFNTLEAVNEEAEEDSAGSEDERKTYVCHQSESIRSGDGNISPEKGYSYQRNDREAKILKFNTDEDSGNDHRSCEEHVDEDRPKIKYEQLSCSMEEDLSDEDGESSSDEERVDMRHRQEPAVTEKQSDVIKCEVTMENEISQSVAERVILLEQQVADSQKRTYSTRGSEGTHCSQRSYPLESEEESSSESPTSQHGFCTRSAPQSSLSFSYDSSGVITTEPEGRVRSIREMFLAKSVADIQPRRVSYPNASELLENRGETSVSGGYHTQTSSEMSTGEDDSVRQSIAKGFVRRTIERLYGKKEARHDEEAGGIPPPAPKHKNKEPSSILSSLQMARSKAMSELSYFNSTHALDNLTGATRCIAFNAQVGPGDSVPIDSGRWLLGENTLIRKSISDPVGINKTFSNAPGGEKVQESTEEDVPYSLFSTKSDTEDRAKSVSRKCTYFSLPHCSDSDVCQDEASKGSLNGDTVVEVKDDSEDGKTWAERNGQLPHVGVTDYKKMDNKVHPLTEPAPAVEVVVVQPAKSQGAVNRRLQDPDMLDFLYNFCGQHCPIL